MFGGLILIVLFWNIHILQQMSVSSLYWGIAIAIFGTILPPLLFTKGIPAVGISLGNILASLEIPVSILSAVIILNESVEMIQWGGILLILFAIVLINKRVEQY
ncbi:EamA-like transporter family protein [compost metagenome]